MNPMEGLEAPSALGKTCVALLCSARWKEVVEFLLQQRHPVLTRPFPNEGAEGAGGCGG